MIKRITALLLALITLCSGALAAEAVVTRAISIIGSQESGNDYGCAETDTNGKASLGFMQWNGSRAAALLRAIIAADEEGASEILGASLCNELKDAETCVLSSAELSKVSALLKSAAGKSKQDEKALSDVSAYVKKARSLGIKDLTAICYYCDIVHQVGTGAIVKYHVKAAELAGGYPKITLEHLYKAALVYATHTKARRTRVYNMLLKNPVGGEASEEPSEASLTITRQGPVELKRYEKLKIEYKLDNSSAAVLWKSSAPGVARVNKNGVVRGVKRGKATITAYTATGLKDSVAVRVIK